MKLSTICLVLLVVGSVFLSAGCTETKASSHGLIQGKWTNVSSVGDRNMSTTFDFSDDGTLTIVLSDVDTGNSSSIAYTYNFINDSSFEIDYKDLITRRIYSDLYDGPLDTFEIIGITDKEIILGSSKSIFMTNDSYSSRYIYLTRL